MPESHSYHRPLDPDSASEEDLDLDELDPAANGHASADVPLRRIDAPVTGRLWKSRRNAHKGRHEDDELGLLGHWDDDLERGWNVKKSRRKPTPSTDQSKLPNGGHSRRQSYRQSMQLPDFVRQELEDMKEDAEAGNQKVRDLQVGRPQKKGFPTNIVSNAKYTAWSFLPLTLYNEFKFFLNIYFLLVALSQIIKYLRIGYMSTYIVPLAVVLSISIGKEAFDDIGRRRRDAEANAEPFTVLSFPNPRQHGDVAEVQKRSRDIKVGDVLKLEKNQRVPADVVILQTRLSETSKPDETLGAESGTEAVAEAFIRTDQLDGETDWKLRLPSALSQRLQFAGTPSTYEFLPGHRTRKSTNSSAP